MKDESERPPPGFYLFISGIAKQALRFSCISCVNKTVNAQFFIHIKNYNTLQYITMHYSTLQYITIHYNTYNTLQYITIHYNTLQYITIHYNTLQYITIHAQLLPGESRKVDAFGRLWNAKKSGGYSELMC